MSVMKTSRGCARLPWIAQGRKSRSGRAVRLERLQNAVGIGEAGSAGMISPTVPEPLPSHERSRMFIVVAVFVAVYIPSRFFLLVPFTPIGSDVDLYARFAFIHARAHETKCSFYDHYRSVGLKDRTFADYSLRDLTEIPYPPLAIGFLAIPGRIILHGNSTDTVGFTDFVSRYQKAYRWVCLPFDAGIVLLVLWLIVTVFRGEPKLITLIRSGMACGAAAILRISSATGSMLCYRHSCSCRLSHS